MYHYSVCSSVYNSAQFLDSIQQQVSLFDGGLRGGGGEGQLEVPNNIAMYLILEVLAVWACGDDHTPNLINLTVKAP